MILYSCNGKKLVLKNAYKMLDTQQTDDEAFFALGTKKVLHLEETHDSGTYVVVLKNWLGLKA